MSGVSPSQPSIVEQLRTLYATHPICVEAASRIELLETSELNELALLRTQLAGAKKALEDLVNAEALAGVRAIVAGWNGEGREGYPFQRHPANLGATLPKTRCAAIYALDEAIEAGCTTLKEIPNGNS